MITEQLNALKAQGNFSWQELSDMTGIPVPTIRKTFSGETANPSFEVVSKLMTAMGETLSATQENQDEDFKKKEGDEEMQAAMEQIKAVYEARIADLWNIINKLTLEKRTLFITMMVVITGLVGFIIYLFADGMHGNWGFFRY